MPNSQSYTHRNEKSLAPMFAGSMESAHETEAAKLLFTVQSAAETRQIWYRVAHEELRTSNDSLLASTLFPAMRERVPLEIDGSVSPRLLSNVPTIQKIVRSWEPSYSEITVKATSAQLEPAKSKRGVGCFFTAGLDSFYTALKNRDEITHLVFVHGFDVPLTNLDLRRAVSQSLREIAAKLQKTLIEVETNLREFSDRYIGWELYHGAALAAVGHLLSGRLHKLYIAASRSYADIVPLGSHPLLDPLWSTETLEFVHDGCEATRIEKAMAISADREVLKHLRVCWENQGGAYNCGKCEKCLRTMACLRTIGVLDDCSVFSSPLDLKALAGLNVEKIHRAHFAHNLGVLERSGSDAELADALRKCLRRQVRKDIAKSLRQQLRARLN